MMDWTDQSENMVKEIGDLSTGYKAMYRRASKIYGRIHFFLLVTVYICSGVSSTVTVYNILTPFEQFNAFSLSLSIIELILLIFMNQGKFDELSKTYMSYAAKYAGISSNVRRQLLLDRKDREPMPNYTAWITNSYDNLFELGPSINDWIIRDYARKAKEKGLPVPEIVKHISPIAIADGGDVKIHVRENSLRYTDINMKYELDRLKRHK